MILIQPLCFNKIESKINTNPINNFVVKNSNGLEWNLEQINISGAWAITQGKREVIVASISFGVDISNSEISHAIWNNTGEIPNNGIDDDSNGYIDDYHGWDFADYDNDTSPITGNSLESRGTYIAGTIVATNNGIGLTGIAPNVTLMPIKVLREDNPHNINVYFCWNAIEYAMDNGADVILIDNLDWDTNYEDFSSIELYVSLALASNIPCFSGQINNTLYPPRPADFTYFDRDVIGALGIDVNKETKSEYNKDKYVDLSAPGISVNCTGIGNTYSLYDGCIIAAAHIAGVAALLKSVNPSLTQRQIRGILHSTSYYINDNLPNCINATAALNEAYNIDNIYPSINIDYPIHGGTVYSEDFTASWIGSDVGWGIDYYTIRFDSGMISDTGTIFVGKNTTYDFSLSEGSHKIRVVALDFNGNSVTDSNDFTVSYDITSPEINILHPTNNSVINTNHKLVSWIGFDSESGIDFYEIKIDAGIWINKGKDLSHNFTNLFEEREYDVLIRAWDNVGNSNTSHLRFRVNFDTSMPIISGMLPVLGSTVYTNHGVTVTWFCVDTDSGIAYNEIDINGTGWINVGSNTSHYLSINESCVYTFFVRVTDWGNNSAIYPTVFWVVYDIIPPVLSLTQPVNNTDYTDTNDVYVRWFITDDSPIGTVWLVLYQYVLIPLVIENLNLGSGAREYTFEDLDIANFLVNVTVFDAAGNAVFAFAFFEVLYEEPESEEPYNPYTPKSSISMFYIIPTSISIITIILITRRRKKKNN